MNEPNLPANSSQKSDTLVTFLGKIIQSFLALFRGLTDEDARALLAAHGFYDFELEHVRKNQRHSVHRDPAFDEMVEQIEFAWPEDLALRTYTLQTPKPFSYLHTGERRIIASIERRTNRKPRRAIRRSDTRFNA